MATNTLNILRPSVNNLSTRIFVRAAGLDFDEVDMWGKKGTPEFLAKDPADLTPLLEEEGLPRGSLWESCAIMQYLCNKHGLERFYPSDPAKRAMVDSAMFYVIGTLYPYITRATYPTLNFPQYAGEVGASDAGDEAKARAAEAATAAVAQPLEAFRAFFLAGNRFIGGDEPSIADIRLAASLEFLRAVDYEFPAWAEEYLAAVESALGDAYSEPAGDVRGYIESVKGAPVSA
jgi:glutathione S-transferase